MTAALTFDRVSKHYRGAREYRALRDDLVGVGRRMARGERARRTPVRALEDVSFEIQEGAAVALMGLNGSGKTTALKILSRITYPTTGKVRVRGRVGALLEVGTGLHPELTGRENIALYGVILGLSRKETVRRFDQIVEFAEIGHALDQPVKQYSSGMQLRLGFSLAAHLQPDVLLVDEAISVGDAGFQFKCLELISSLVDSGVTLLFVSHVPGLVAGLCRSGILLDRGRVVRDGTVSDVIGGYLDLAKRGVSGNLVHDEPLAVRGWEWRFAPGRGALGDLSVDVHLDVSSPVRNAKLGVALTDGRPGNLVTCSMLVDGYETGCISGPITVSCLLRELPLEPGSYAVWFSAMTDNGLAYLAEPRLLGYATLGDVGWSELSRFAGTTGHGPVRVSYEWQVHQVQDER